MIWCEYMFNILSMYDILNRKKKLWASMLAKTQVARFNLLVQSALTASMIEVRQINKKNEDVRIIYLISWSDIFLLKVYWMTVTVSNMQYELSKNTQPMQLSYLMFQNFSETRLCRIAYLSSISIERSVIPKACSILGLNSPFTDFTKFLESTS